jgi:hypothetical protein
MRGTRLGKHAGPNWLAIACDHVGLEEVGLRSVGPNWPDGLGDQGGSFTNCSRDF